MNNTREPLLAKCTSGFTSFRGMNNTSLTQADKMKLYKQNRYSSLESFRENINQKMNETVSKITRNISVKLNNKSNENLKFVNTINLPGLPLNQHNTTNTNFNRKVIKANSEKLSKKTENSEENINMLSTFYKVPCQRYDPVDKEQRKKMFNKFRINYNITKDEKDEISNVLNSESNTSTLR